MLKYLMFAVIMVLMTSCCRTYRDQTMDNSEVQMRYGVQITQYFWDKEETKENLLTKTIGNDPTAKQLYLFLLEIERAIYLQSLSIEDGYVVERPDDLRMDILFCLAQHPAKEADELLASLEYNRSFSDAGGSLSYNHAVSIRGESCIKLLKNKDRQKDVREVIRTGRPY